jgi:hypothetical protein
LDFYSLLSSSACVLRGMGDLYQEFLHGFPGIVLRPLCYAIG